MHWEQLAVPTGRTASTAAAPRGGHRPRAGLGEDPGGDAPGRGAGAVCFTNSFPTRLGGRARLSAHRRQEVRVP